MALFGTGIPQVRQYSSSAAACLIIYEAMFVTNGSGSAASAATLYKANFNVQ